MIRTSWPRNGLCWISCLLVLAILVNTQCYAITASEKAALLQIMDNYPLLSHTSFNAQNSRRWNASQVDTVCAPLPQDHLFYGLMCSGSNIYYLRIDENWGSPIRDQFDAFSGLTALKNFVFAPTAYGTESVSTLFTQLPNITTLTELSVITQQPMPSVVSQAIGNLTGLTDLELACDFSATSLNLSLLTSLRQLTLDDSRGGNASASFMTALSTITPMLQTLIMPATALTDTLPLAYLTDLTVLNVRMTSDAYFDFSHLSPPGLVSLELSNLPKAFKSLNFGFLTLTSLSLKGGSLETISGWPPSANSINITQHANFSETALPPLPFFVSDLSITGSNVFSSFPDDFFTNCEATLRTLYLTDLPNLTRLSSGFSRLNLVEFDASNTGIIDPQELCKLPNATLETITIQRYRNGWDASPLPFAPCFANFTVLTTVVVGTIWNAPPGILRHLPPTVEHLTMNDISPALTPSYNWTSLNLATLVLNNCGLVGTFPNELVQLRNLETLSLRYNALHGTIAPNFFNLFNGINTIDVSYNQLDGPIPNRLPPTLGTAYFSSNRFTSFGDPVIVWSGLVALSVDFNQLSSLPSDALWKTQMPNLRRLSLGNNPGLSGMPLPAFWTNHPTLSEVSLNECGFTGTVPAIHSPRLSKLNLNGNQLCGALPEFAAPFALIPEVSLASNSFSGSIPDSYANITFGTLDISSNHLAGDFSIASIFASIGNQHVLNTLSVSDNDLFGGIPNLNSTRVLKGINVTKTLVDLCQTNPAFLPTLRSCPAANVPNGGSCGCGSWYASCDTSANNCQTGDYIPRPTTSYPACGTTPIPLPAILTCDPATRPSPDFACVKGAWATNTSITAPIVVSAPIVIFGNLTSPTVTITNPSAFITVKGCVTTETVVIVLSPAQVEALEKDPSKSKLLLTQLGSNCSTSLSSTQVTASVTKKGCKKVQATNDHSKSTPASLFVTFKVTTASCKTWWIILVSVIGGVLIITIALVILALKWKKLHRLVPGG